MPVARVLEYTEQHIVEDFKPKGVLDIERLIRLPALFMSETFRENDPVARVGTITRARVTGRDVTLEYFYDADIPPPTNSRIAAFSDELSIEDFEFHRTHWAVKDADLFHALIRNIQPRRQLPKVFSIADPEDGEPSLVSVMMPFHPAFDSVYAVIKDTAATAGLRCRRADDIWEAPAVIQDVVSLIDRSRLVICDCSERNPNVFYEAGIAHTLGRDVILITQNEADIPFDLRHLRYVRYLNNNEGRATLAERLQTRFESLA